MFVLALLRAVLSLAVVLDAVLGTEMKVGDLKIGGVAFVDVGVLGVLAFSVYRRQLWAGYGLVVYSAILLPVQMTHSLAGGISGLFWVWVFTMGTIHLFRSMRFTSPLQIDLFFVLRWGLGLLLIAFVSGFLLTFNPSLLADVFGPPGSPTRLWATRILAYILMLGIQTLAAMRRTEWPLEHVLGAAVVATIAGALIDLPFGRSLAQSISTQGPLFALTFLGWWIAQRQRG